MSDRYDTPRWDDEEVPDIGTSQPPRFDDPDSLDLASENVLEDWPGVGVDSGAPSDGGPQSDGGSAEDASEPGVASVAVEAGERDEPESGDGLDVGAAEEDADAVHAPLADHLSETSEHAPGDLIVPPGFAVLEGEARGARRTVGVVVARFNGDVTTRLLESALEELEAKGVDRDSITVMPVPGAFELPLAAMALAKTRRFACIVALGCVIRGDTAHFDYVSSEAASGLQLAGIETGIPVAFGVLTLDRIEQAASRVGKGAEAVRTALEMADLFANLRAAASKG
jgi:6,7-dimethyl-8-ribityllumazine synthase